jgi:hypothetical protein
LTVAIRSEPDNVLRGVCTIVAGNGLSFVWMFSGNRYLVKESQCLADLVSDIVAHRFRWSIRSPLIEQYELVQCDAFEAFPSSAPGTLSQAHQRQYETMYTLPEIAAELEATGLRCERSGKQFLRVDHQGTEALIHVCVDKPESSFGIMIYGLWPDGAGNYELLRAISQCLDCVVFDTGWHVKIEWDDPYYMTPPSETSPEQPRLLANNGGAEAEGRDL